MSEESVMLSGRVPQELKELIDADRRDNQEVLRAALWREFGGERQADIERRIEEKERRVSMIKSEKNERERELHREQNELEALKSKLEIELEEKQEGLDKAHEALQDVPWKPDNPGVEHWAGKLDIEPETLISELEDYDDS